MLKYEKLIHKLRDRLANGGPEDRLPPLAILAREEGLSLNTVHHAIQELKKEGLIVTRAGRGTFARQNSPFEVPALRDAGADTAMPEGLPLRFIAFTSSIRHVISNPFGNLLLKGFENILASEGKGRGIHFHGGQIHRKLIPVPPEAAAQRACGTVCVAPFSAAYLTHLTGQCRPVVSIDRDATPWGADSVVLDNAGAALLATHHLLELGHREIAFLGAEQTEVYEAGIDPAFRERTEGFRLAHLLRGLEPRPELMVRVKALTAESYDEAADEFLDGKPRFTAILTYDEGFGLRALEKLRARGLSVPRDCSLAHCGSLNAGAQKISGAAFDIQDLSARAWRLLQQAWKRPREKDLLAVREIIPAIFHDMHTVAAAAQR